MEYVLLYLVFLFFFFKQKTAYEVRISDWSSDVSSSDLPRRLPAESGLLIARVAAGREPHAAEGEAARLDPPGVGRAGRRPRRHVPAAGRLGATSPVAGHRQQITAAHEHTHRYFVAVQAQVDVRHPSVRSSRDIPQHETNRTQMTAT